MLRMGGINCFFFVECLLCVGTGIDGGGPEFPGSKFCEDCSVL